MRTAKNLTSLTLSVREKANIRVRQPLAKILVPVVNEDSKKIVEKASDYVLSETNIKNLEILGTDSDVLVKKVKPNFKTLGKKLGKSMKAAVPVISNLNPNELSTLEAGKNLKISVANESHEITPDDITISFVDVPGLLISSGNGFTVALDTEISEDLKLEGISRELINRIQNLRKDSALEVTDRIKVTLLETPEVKRAIDKFKDHITGETLADSLDLASDLDGALEVSFDNVKTSIALEKI